MALFKYTAKNKEGEQYDRTVEAADRFALYGIIRAEGGTVIAIKEASKKSSFFSLSLGQLLGSIKTQDKINFAKNLGSMVSAGLSVTRALNVLGKQSKKKALHDLTANLESDLSRGLTLSEAFANRPKAFSPLVVSMVKAGEESGSVAEALKIVAAQMEKSHQLGKKIKGAMIYPAVIISVMLILGVLLLVYMVPTLTATFKGLNVPLPLPTRVIIGLSDFAIAHSLLLLVALILLAFASLAFWRSKEGRRTFDVVSLKIPVIGTMVREVQVARTARTLSSLLSSGVDVVVALEVTGAVLQNHLYKDALDSAHGGIQKGETLSAAFGRYPKLYPVFVGEMASVGEETGKVSEMLGNVAEYYEEEVDQKTKDLSTIIEPVLMIIIGAGVGVFAIAMLAPTYSLVNYIN